MLNSVNWSQYDDEWDQTDRDLNVNYDRMLLLQENTDYEFSTGQKLGAELEDVSKTVTSELNDAVSQNWNIIKYTPAILLGAGVLVILSHSNMSNIKKALS